MARKDIRLTESEQVEVLAETRNLQVATNGPGGFPHLTTLWFFVDDGLITFRSFTKSQRIVNLRRDDRITALAESGEDYDELRGLMIQGHARLSTDPDDVMGVYAEVSKKMQGLDEITDEAVEAMYGRFAVKNTVVRIEPAKVVSWDHGKLAGSY